MDHVRVPIQAQIPCSIANPSGQVETVEELGKAGWIPVQMVLQVALAQEQAHVGQLGPPLAHTLLDIIVEGFNDPLGAWAEAEGADELLVRPRFLHRDGKCSHAAIFEHLPRQAVMETALVWRSRFPGRLSNASS